MTCFYCRGEGEETRPLINYGDGLYHTDCRVRADQAQQLPEPEVFAPASLLARVLRWIGGGCRV